MTANPPLTRQQIRDQRRGAIPEPEEPATNEEIRRQLGWTILQAERAGQQERAERDD